MDKTNTSDCTPLGKKPPSTPSKPGKPKNDPGTLDGIDEKLDNDGGQDASRDDAFGDMIRKSDRE